MGFAFPSTDPAALAGGRRCRKRLILLALCRYGMAQVRRGCAPPPPYPPPHAGEGREGEHPLSKATLWAGACFMTYVVVENCIKCKYMDCVEVCPVDCFYEGANMLVIHPDECIDCGVCEPECPAEAIKPDTEPGLEKWLELNTEYSKSWPNISVKREGPADGKEWDGVEGKLKYFDPEPGTGD